MTSKQRAFLKSLAMTTEPAVRIGKESLTPEVVKSVSEALEANELVKIAVLNNCFDDCKELSLKLAQRTRSSVVQIIGRRIVLYKEAEDPDKRKIDLVRLRRGKAKEI